MTTVIFEYNGKSKEIPINEIKSVNDVADAYEKLGIELSLSCTPYDNILEKGNASWAESNQSKSSKLLLCK